VMKIALTGFGCLPQPLKSRLPTTRTPFCGFGRDVVFFFLFLGGFFGGESGFGRVGEYIYKSFTR
jgi:hypothetical protein